MMFGARDRARLERVVALAEMADRQHREILAAITALDRRLDQLQQRRRTRPADALKQPAARAPVPGLGDLRRGPRRAAPFDEGARG